MGAAGSEDDPADVCATDPAGQAFTTVDPVLNLEKAGLALGVHVIRDGRATGADG